MSPLTGTPSEPIPPTPFDSAAGQYAEASRTWQACWSPDQDAANLPLIDELEAACLHLAPEGTV